jgi:hypothetical protein
LKDKGILDPRTEIKLSDPGYLGRYESPGMAGIFRRREAEMDERYKRSDIGLDWNEQAAESDAQFNARRNQLLQRAEQVSGETEASRAFNLRLQANMRRIRQQENDAPIPQISPERAAANSEWFRNADRVRRSRNSGRIDQEFEEVQPGDHERGTSFSLNDPNYPFRVGDTPASTIQALNRFRRAAGYYFGPDNATPRGQEWRAHVEQERSEQAARDNSRNLSPTALENLRAMYTSPENLAMLGRARNQAVESPATESPSWSVREMHRLARLARPRD